MSLESNMTFRIGLVGPSRVGKTSLIATMLRDAQRILASSTARIEPNGTASERRLQQHDNELRGALWAGEFNPGAVAGTEGPFTFELRLVPEEGADPLIFGLRDFPGGWIDAALRPESRNADWEAYKNWLAQSSVLIVPVESTVLMEATASSQKRAVPSMLAIQQVQSVIEHWAKKRRDVCSEPALLVLCPVKCESYFSDNGGRGSGAVKLHEDVCMLYGSAIKAARDAAPHVKVMYAPVDTLGCVNLIRTQWRKNSDTAGGFDFTATFRVLPPGEIKPKGGDSLMALLCNHVLQSVHLAEKRLEGEIKGDFAEADLRSKEDKGLFGNFWLLINGDRAARRITAGQAKDRLVGQREKVAALSRALKPLAEFKLDSRIIDLK